MFEKQECYDVHATPSRSLTKVFAELATDGVYMIQTVLLYNASGDRSPSVFRSAVLYALCKERSSSPYSDCVSICSWGLREQLKAIKGPITRQTHVEIVVSKAARS